MRVRGSRGTRHWFRLPLAVLALIVVVVVLGIEASHFRTWHHFVWFGVHTHILQTSADIGIPGISNMYDVAASNYTPLSIQLHGCKLPNDVSPYYNILYRYQVDKWKSSTETWDKIMAVSQDCPADRLVITTLRPGDTMQLIGWEATGARDGLEKGDMVRFSVFTAFNDSNDAPGQRTVVSPTFLIEDHRLDLNSNSRRIGH